MQRLFSSDCKIVYFLPWTDGFLCKTHKLRARFPAGYTIILNVFPSGGGFHPAARYFLFTILCVTP